MSDILLRFDVFFLNFIKVFEKSGYVIVGVHFLKKRLSRSESQNTIFHFFFLSRCLRGVRMDFCAYSPLCRKLYICVLLH